MMLFVTGCATEEAVQREDPINNIEEKEYQAKLDALKPAAYGSVSGLKVDPGAYLSIIGRNAGDSFWNEVEAGARQAVEDLNAELGYTGDDKVKLNYSAPKTRDDVDGQVNILDEELAEYPIAVGIASTDMKACQVQFDLALENSIPIVTMDSGSEYKDVAAFCGTDNTKAAKLAADKLAESIGDEGEVAVFVQDSTSMTAKQREKGFIERIRSDHPNVKVVAVYRFDELKKMAEKIAKEDKCDASQVTQEDVFQYLLGKNPDLKGIFTTNLDVTQEVMGFLTLISREIKVVGFDGGAEQMQYVESENLEGVIVQNPFGMGYATVVAMLRASLGMGNEAKVDSGYTWVTKENMNDAEIQKILY